MEGLDWQTVHIPFGRGLNQKMDERALDPPELTLLTDAEFDELGALQTRKPSTDLGLAIVGGGSIDPDDVRGIVPNGTERLLFTKDALYSWIETEQAWISKGTHLAVATSEATVFARTGDQMGCDRAELGGYVMYSWHEIRGATTYGFVAVMDKATGAVTYAPHELSSHQRIRLTALDDIVLLSYFNGTDTLYCKGIDPASPSAGLVGAATSVTTALHVDTPYYDVCRVPGSDVAIFATKLSSTDYEIVKITGALARTASTKARICEGQIAIAVTPDGASAQIVRTERDGALTYFHGDLITVSSLADVYTNQALDLLAPESTLQVTVAYRDVQVSGQYRAHYFSSHYEVDSGLFGHDLSVCRTNYVDTGNNIGTAGTFLPHLGVASRAFAHDGDVYFWGAFAESSIYGTVGGNIGGVTLQNTYFLYRSDGLLVAKAASSRAGGFSPLVGWIGTVQEVDDGYAWCASERRIVPVGGDRSRFGKRAPRDVIVEFDSKKARRVARLGRTLYVTGGEILQYDGEGLTEVGFHVYPWFFSGLEDTGGANLENGTYSYKWTWRWENSQGEVDRSTTASIATFTVAGGPSEFDLQVSPLYYTHKTGDRSEVVVEAWRTAIDPPPGAPFYLVTSNNPATTTGDNRFVENDPTTTGYLSFTDDLADDDLTDYESSPENGGVLENLAPPPATIIAATAERLFLAGIPGDPDRVWYSKLRAEGEVASFHDALTIPVPRDGGAITAIEFLNETLVVFRERAIYALPGDGFDNTGGGTNYGPARILSLDVGAESAEAVALEPRGITFHGRKGKYLLNRGWGVDYIGGPVKAYDSEPVLAVHVLESKHQVRWLTASRMLVCDYSAATQQQPVGQWSEWTIADGVHACIWDGDYAYLSDELGPRVQADDYGDDVNYGIDVETAWIKPAEQQGRCRVRRIEILGEYRGEHALRVRISRDYETTPFYDEIWTPSPTTIGGPLQLKIGPSIQRCEAIKVRLTVVDTFVGEGGDPEDPDIIAATTEAVKLTGLALEVGLKRGLHRRLPAAQKV